MKKCLLVFTSFLFLFTTHGFAQEALKSIEEEYYDFLSLTGVVERPTLGYRTLSDGVWNFKDVESFEENEDGTFTKVRIPGAESDNHIWKNNNLGTTYKLWAPSAPAENWFANGLKQGLTARIYGPEWFNSYNTAAPYGQNDGALWQGRGYNTSLTAGVRLEGYGFELTFKPQVSFSQNKEFTIMKNTGYYTNKFAYLWGYGSNVGIDAPQRFGNESFWNYDFGDSELRWTWNSFTVGFGTESIWLGPAWLNPMLGSNNATSYPKFDIGIRRTSVTIPWLDTYLGDIEFRIWMGYLTESKFFDNVEENNNNRINGFYFSYAPSFIQGLSIGVTKICLSKWTNFELKYLNPFYNDNGGIGAIIGEDQKASFFMNYINKKNGFEIYGEYGIDDYLQGGVVLGLIRYPFDSSIWTIGIKKAIQFNNPNFEGELIIEFSDMEEPRNKISSKMPYSFNFHHQITQGYTNRGQYIGTSLANGGNSQLIKFNLYYLKGVSSIYVQRCNPDNTYSYINLNNYNNTYKAFFLFGINTNYFITKSFIINSGIDYKFTINPFYYTIQDSRIEGTNYMNNFSFTLLLKYSF